MENNEQNYTAIFKAIYDMSKAGAITSEEKNQLKNLAMQRTPAIIEHLQDYVKHSDEMKFKQSLMGLVRAEEDCLQTDSDDSPFQREFPEYKPPMIMRKCLVKPLTVKIENSALRLTHEALTADREWQKVREGFSVVLHNELNTTQESSLESSFQNDKSEKDVLRGEMAQCASKRIFLVQECDVIETAQTQYDKVQQKLEMFALRPKNVSHENYQQQQIQKEGSQSFAASPTSQQKFKYYPSHQTDSSDNTEIFAPTTYKRWFNK